VSLANGHPPYRYRHGWIPIGQELNIRNAVKDHDRVLTPKPPGYNASALAEYGDGAYFDLNKSLRRVNGDPSKMTGSIGNNFSLPAQDFVKKMDDSMSTLKQDSVLYRAVSSDAVGSHDVGSEFDDPAFISTSTSAHNQLDGPVLMVLHVPKGTKAQLNTESPNSFESEMILGRGQRFRITAVEPATGKSANGVARTLTIHADVIPYTRNVSRKAVVQ
jgi:hypothetical protein